MVGLPATSTHRTSQLTLVEADLAVVRVVHVEVQIPLGLAIDVLRALVGDFLLAQHHGRRAEQQERRGGAGRHQPDHSHAHPLDASGFGSHGSPAARRPSSTGASMPYRYGDPLAGPF